MSFNHARAGGTLADRATRPRLFYGWWIVAACLTSGTVANALGLYGAGVYLHTVTTVMGWSIGLVSGGITVFYVVSALLLALVGAGIGRYGPRPVVGLGALTLAVGVAGIGQASQPWHVYAAFLVMGVGWSCLSMTAITATLAPWFDRRYGRAVSIASLGASIGGIIGPPVLVLGIARVGFPVTTAAASVLTVMILLPLAWFVLRRCPQDMGLVPDGAPPHAAATAAGDAMLESDQGPKHCRAGQRGGELWHWHDGADRLLNSTGRAHHPLPWRAGCLRRGLHHRGCCACRSPGARPLC